MLEAIGTALVELLIVKIFYWPGRVFLKGLTLGKYPPAVETSHNREFVACMGLVGLTLPWIIYAIT